MRVLAWLGDGSVITLKATEFSEAWEEADAFPDEINWLFTEESLREFIDNAREALAQPVETP